MVSALPSLCGNPSNGDIPLKMNSRPCPNMCNPTFDHGTYDHETGFPVTLVTLVPQEHVAESTGIAMY